jgi:hypothetical protein
VIQLIGDPDYEKKSLYQLKILATDRSNFGRVNTATAAILVEIEDIADNPPEFVSVPSITRISEDVPRFTEVGFFSFWAIYRGRTQLQCLNCKLIDAHMAMRGKRV